jgi:hypothetical protein
MEIDLPVPIDDSISQPQQLWTDKQEEPEPVYYHQQQPQQQEEPVYYQQQPESRYYIQPQETQTRKKFDIFSELDKTHGIIIIACILLAFFMGKSIATPIIIRSVS